MSHVDDHIRLGASAALPQSVTKEELIVSEGNFKQNPELRAIENKRLSHPRGEYVPQIPMACCGIHKEFLCPFLLLHSLY